jgi:replication factor C subunit 3/5
MPHLLFYGPPGTGKTSTIQAACRYLYGPRSKGNVLELNASDDRGIDVVRNVIKDFASTGQFTFGPSAFIQPAAPTATDGDAAAAKPATSELRNRVAVPPTFKIVILDEADQMSGEAQAALRRVIEQYTRNVRFCILCNHVNKIIPAVQSRCTRFRFAPVKKADMMPRLLSICAAEQVHATDAGVAAAFRLSGGDMRRCLNMLQAAAIATGEVTEPSVYRAAGYPTPDEVSAIVHNMFTLDFSSAWSAVSRAMESGGLSVVDLIRELHPLLQRLDLPGPCKCLCYTQLADAEYNLSVGSTESIALASVLATLQLVKETITRQQAAAS